MLSNRVPGRAKRLPYIVAIGGTQRPNSSTECALRIALAAAGAAGAQISLISGAALDLPLYAPHKADRNAAARHLVEEVRRADGILIGSPGYHAGVSGLVKNALDYIEDLREDPRSYLDGRAVGIIATGSGWQGAVITVEALRGIVHALRGWPTPLGVAINTAERVFDDEGQCLSSKLQTQLVTLASQVVEFARQRTPFQPQPGLASPADAQSLRSRALASNKTN